MYSMDADLQGSLALDGEPGRKQVLCANKPPGAIPRQAGPALLPSEGAVMCLSPQLLH